MKKKLIISAVALTIIAGTATATLAEYGDRQGKDHKGFGKMFETMDADKDGVITKTEADDFQAKKFAKLDTNNDGKITQDETKARREAKMKERCEKYKD